MVQIVGDEPYACVHVNKNLQLDVHGGLCANTKCVCVCVCMCIIKTNPGEEIYTKNGR